MASHCSGGMAMENGGQLPAGARASAEEVPDGSGGMEDSLQEWVTSGATWGTSWLKSAREKVSSSVVRELPISTCAYTPPRESGFVVGCGTSSSSLLWVAGY